ncbi:MAG: LamG domain-containing protein [Candidatus Diapherotrites archaeon]|uniref:LamG domain-containing protein n=1 Tax=Candidatus Iainarchaeum sp. TaxID=3101447 RepID=A0A8T3YP83_9ARCH|nr:LamG domain-containing protein [Candidatus Diapherotrites archaeon]
MKFKAIAVLLALSVLLLSGCSGLFPAKPTQNDGICDATAGENVENSPDDCVPAGENRQLGKAGLPVDPPADQVSVADMEIYVKDQTGNPVEGATVFIYRPYIFGTDPNNKWAGITGTKHGEIKTDAAGKVGRPIYLTIDVKFAFVATKNGQSSGVEKTTVGGKNIVNIILELRKPVKNPWAFFDFEGAKPFTATNNSSITAVVGGKAGTAYDDKLKSNVAEFMQKGISNNDKLTIKDAALENYVKKLRDYNAIYQNRGYTITMWVNPKRTTTNQSIIAFTNDEGPEKKLSQQLRISNGVFQHYTFDTAPKTVTGTTKIAPETWYFVAITAGQNKTPSLSGTTTGQARLFVNGQEDGTPVTLGKLWDEGYTYEVAAKTALGYDSLYGTIDNLRIYNEELTPQEIAGIYRSEIVNDGIEGALHTQSVSVSGVEISNRMSFRESLDPSAPGGIMYYGLDGVKHKIPFYLKLVFTASGTFLYDGETIHYEVSNDGSSVTFRKNDSTGTFIGRVANDSEIRLPGASGRTNEYRVFITPSSKKVWLLLAAGTLNPDEDGKIQRDDVRNWNSIIFRQTAIINRPQPIQIKEYYNPKDTDFATGSEYTSSSSEFVAQFSITYVGGPNGFTEVWVDIHDRHNPRNP